MKRKTTRKMTYTHTEEGHLTDGIVQLLDDMKRSYVGTETSRERSDVLITPLHGKDAYDTSLVRYSKHIIKCQMLCYTSLLKSQYHTQFTLIYAEIHSENLNSS